MVAFRFFPNPTLSFAVAYLDFGSRGGPASATCSKGTFSFKYNNFVHSENMISERMAIFKKNTVSANSLNIYRISLDLIYISLTFKWTPVVPWLSYSPLDPRFAVSNPDGVCGFFQGLKILSMTSFGREVKPRVPCRRFTARKRTSSQN